MTSHQYGGTHGEKWPFTSILTLCGVCDFNFIVYIFISICSIEDNKSLCKCEKWVFTFPNVNSVAVVLWKVHKLTVETHALLRASMCSLAEAAGHILIGNQEFWLGNGRLSTCNGRQQQRQDTISLANNYFYCDFLIYSLLKYELHI